MSQIDDEVLASTVVTHDAPPVEHLQLIVIGPGTVATHAIAESGVLTIGRSSNCEITIDDASISRRHAVLRVGVGDNHSIEDLGSANGTLVRGAKLQRGKPVAIGIGELVGIGKASVLLQHRTRQVRQRRLWTHDYFDARLDEECARVHRSGTPFALLHVRPDASATFVEETLAMLVRESDVLGQYGPREYEVLMLEAAPAKATEAAERLRRKLAQRGIRCEIAIACCPHDGRSPYELTARVRGGAPTAQPGEIIVTDPQMQNLHRMVAQIAASRISVLLLGETGVGKEVFARAVHRGSPRASGPFVEINCAAVTETLLESELFGHEKGAFTHATSAKPGLIEAANGGTLFLDELGDMPLATQAKLLRVIEDEQLRRVGALKSRAIDVRFVAATNSDLDRQVAAGAFRRDLYFRLNGVTITIPPLRERLGELEQLARAFLRGVQLTDDALEVMRAYSWPGNVRELKNMMERAVLLSGGGPIGPEHLPRDKMTATLLATAAAPLPRAATSSRGSADELSSITEALAQANGNQTVAARLLGISRRTLVNRLNEYSHLERPRKHKSPSRRTP